MFTVSEELDFYIVTCTGLRVPNIRVLDRVIEFIGTSVSINTTCIYKPYNSAIADLHTFQFTAEHALEFAVSICRRNSAQQWLRLYNVFTIRFLAMDL
jgi:hypothetical protein